MSDYVIGAKAFNRRLTAEIAKSFYLAISVVCLPATDQQNWFDSVICWEECSRTRMNVFYLYR